MESRAVPEPHVLVAAVGAIRAGRGGWGDTSARIDDCSRQVSRERLLRHPLATWQRLAALVDGSTGRFGEQLCSNRKRTRWFDCLVMERLWHRMMGEPGVLPKELALPQLPMPARCNTSCFLRCPDAECTPSAQLRWGYPLSEGS
mmetsp:Transcript_47639/g.107350  ORF Transcript_47639/g.107350 Transcript_47639/m.107350 type:complete len:145 (-) Transcript_47639:176-610(-)